MRKTHSQRMSSNALGLHAYEKANPKSSTVPGLSVKPADALRMYRSGTLQRNLNEFYDPEEKIDLHQLSLIERLELQSKYREDLVALKAKVQAEAEQIEAQRAAEQEQVQSQSKPTE